MSLCRWFYLPIVVALAGCASRAPAPMGAPSAPVVVEGGAAAAPAAVLAAPATGREGFYIVKKGDTLRKIAQDHGRDHRQVAAWNNLTDPNKLEVGQELRIAPPDGEAEVRPIVTVAPVVVAPEPAASTVSGGETLKRWPKGGKIAYSETALVQAKALDGAAAPARAPAATPPQPATAGIATAAVATTPAAPPVPATPPAEAVDWTWPVGGKVISEFVEGGGGKESNKGIDLAGRMGEPVQAAAAGKVTYVGSLRGYGDFLVIRHNSDYISVYAHTSKILVKKDQVVGKGQKIAEVGSSDADQPKLHFEIRQQSRPVDPLKLLPAR
ncbi:MAG: peptidoglycan DD-metalloendopeptidase family protein [Rhodocyclaceae bacterium]|jgi:lipoprotein NlpD|nr:peptidoglycan DD-metalloendopeptidase family protein [Rhodocyclaceae bacterium]MBK6552603.1 peptidoglycan DD-metalloendopeptidase family protein [Rhodocyclaceae bacterium]MBK9312141.1 peptidoglycan DD-metalloendopeptidase family protein [Rhodocyclaceae bacterium]MBK9956198.1 peptidoglycan DD-metalloendopeptidase family protein [Rhodocyclaceae bacterium]